MAPLPDIPTQATTSMCGPSLSAEHPHYKTREPQHSAPSLHENKYAVIKESRAECGYLRVIDPYVEAEYEVPVVLQESDYETPIPYPRNAKNN